MDHWARYYEKLFNFRQIRYFDIKGEYTGLHSKAMTAPDGKIRIPLNEEASKETGQIEEFLRAYNGEGIQHIALACDDLFACYDRLRARGMQFMSAPPAAYYDMLPNACRAMAKRCHELESRGILLDGSTAGGEPTLLCRSSRRRRSARCSSSSSSARRTKASAKAISRRCSSRSNGTRSARGVIGAGKAAKEA